MRELLIEKYIKPTENNRHVIVWRNKEGFFHRNYNLPAVIDLSNGEKTWFKNGWAYKYEFVEINTKFTGLWTMRNEDYNTRSVLLYKEKGRHVYKVKILSKA